MEEDVQTWTLGQLAEIFSGSLEGPSDMVIHCPAPVDADEPSGLTFAQSEEYLAKAESSGVGAVLIGQSFRPASKPAIRVKDPRAVFGMFLAMCDKPLPINAGIHPTAVVSPGASIDPSASIGPYSVIESGAQVGPSCRIFAHCYIGENCVVGDGSTIYPQVVLYKNVQLGSRTILHTGVVLGADGFGYVWDGQRRLKIPQVGGVTLGDDVELGANTTIDRATAGATAIGKGTKIDNQVQIGHNCAVGEHTIIVSQTGVSGSSRIGDRCMLAGQIAISDHVTIGNDVTLAGRSGVMKDITEPGAYFGVPAQPFKQGMRLMALTLKLPELWDRLKNLERKVAEKE